MTDKEQIIDGVDVSKCKQHRKCILPDNIGCKIDDMLCCDKPNCDYKQLQKEKFENLNNRQMVERAENLIYENSELIKNLREKEQENDRYREALEKIERICEKSSTEWEAYKDETCIFHCKTRKTNRAKFADKILNIINKAKGGTNA